MVKEQDFEGEPNLPPNLHPTFQIDPKIDFLHSKFVSKFTPNLQIDTQIYPLQFTVTPKFILNLHTLYTPNMFKTEGLRTPEI